MAPEKEKKRMIWPFLPSKWVKLSVLLILFNFLDCYELIRSPILFYFYFLIRSELVRVDPSWSGPTFVPACHKIVHPFLLSNNFFFVFFFVKWNQEVHIFLRNKTFVWLIKFTCIYVVPFGLFLVVTNWIKFKTANLFIST